jgi:hypothetical protein
MLISLPFFQLQARVLETGGLGYDEVRPVFFFFFMLCTLFLFLDFKTFLFVCLFVAGVYSEFSWIEALHM